MPSFLSFLACIELWERLSYYGMRALLVLYLTSSVGMSDNDSYDIYALFCALGYIGPVLAGMLADKFFGMKMMLITGSIIMCVGHAIMAFSHLSYWVIYLGLVCIAVGTGLFKGNITNLLGNSYDANPQYSRERGFTLFYVSINIGAFIAPLICGYAAKEYGWHIGFALAGVGMLVGTIMYFMYSHVIKDYGNPVVTDATKLFRYKSILFTSLPFIIAVLSFGLYHAKYFNKIMYFFAFCVFVYYAWLIKTADTKKDRDNLVAILILLIFFMLFFAIEMQLASFIALFAERNVDNNFLGFYITAAQSQSINPMAVMVFGILFSVFLKFNPKYRNARFAAGLSTMAICFGIMYFGCINADMDGKVKFSYFLIAITVMSIGELLIAPFLQSQVALISPQNKKGVMMGILMAMLALSNLVGGAVSKLMSVPSSVSGNVDSITSLQIYQDGFVNIILYNAAFVVLFLVFSPLVTKAYKHENQQ